MIAHVKEKVRVIGICGSLRKKSYSRMALKIALKGAQELGAETFLVDLRNFSLPFCQEFDNESDYPEDVFILRNETQKAAGVILGTPDYHGSFSGVLKNALDLMGFKEFQSKTVGLIAVSGGSMGSANALNGLRAIGRQLHAWVIPNQVSIPVAYTKFKDSGEILDLKLRNRLIEFGRQVARFSFLHSSKKTKEFLKEWENAPINPGGR